MRASLKFITENRLCSWISGFERRDNFAKKIIYHLPGGGNNFWMNWSVKRLCDTLFTSLLYNTLRPGQNGHHFPDDLLKCIFLNENIWILINISPKFVPKGPINNIPALVQIMSWRRPGDKPLFEPMMVRSLMHICATRPQWVNMWYQLLLTPDISWSNIARY